MRKAIRLPFLVLIRLYQKSISPDHSAIGKKLYPHGYCLYQPTCSEYTYVSIERYGVLRGSFMGVKRVVRCNPWSSGGWDPPEA